MTQSTLYSELAAKEAGIDLVAFHNEGFVLAMRKQAIAISERQGYVTSDQLRVLAAKAGYKPAHQNAWGAVFRGKQWRVVGRQPSRFPGNHAREIKVWEFTPNG